MRRALLSWMLVFGLLAAGFGATVLALNNDVFSAHGFVRSYLQALQRHDADEALAFAGVEVPEGENTTLLVDAALGEIGDIRFVSEVPVGNTVSVRFSYELSTGKEFTVFTVERTGTRLGLFDRWSFAESPLARLEVAVANDTALTANGVPTAAAVPLLVLAPGGYRLDRETDYLTADAVAVTVTEIGTTVTAELTVGPTAAFTAAATDAVAAYLDGCATQTVLMPTACPFGFLEANRIEGSPAWSMSAYPKLELEATDETGDWRTGAVDANAHIAVTVVSLFDGSRTEVDEDVPFDAVYAVTVEADGSLTARAVS